MVICLERCADLHMAHLMPLSLTVSCFSKIQICFTFLVLAYPGSPDKGPLNVCVCVCARARARACVNFSLNHYSFLDNFRLSFATKFLPQNFCENLDCVVASCLGRDNVCLFVCEVKTR